MDELKSKVNVETSVNITIESDVRFTNQEIQTLISLYLELDYENRKNF